MISDEQNIKNDEIISNLIRNHWGLMKSSMTRFERAIQLKHFAKEYKDLGLDGFGRKIFKIGPEHKELLDSSFCEFTKKFSVFDEKLFGITYKEYNERKITVGKQQIKITNYLKEQIFEAYNKNKNNKKWIDKTNFSFYGEEYLNKNVKEVIKGNVENFFQRTGGYKLPEGELYFVISCNFADWFLCSTAESWGSCLNLEYDCGYWAGLPCMVLDKNRAMAYFTDGKMKNYMGIEVPRILSRSWVLLLKNGSKSSYHIVGEYPNRSSGAGIMAAMKHFTGKNITYERGELGKLKNTKSPYSFELLFGKAGSLKIATTIFFDDFGVSLEKGKTVPKAIYKATSNCGGNIFAFKGKGYEKRLGGYDFDDEKYINLSTFSEVVKSKKKIFGEQY